MAITLAGVHSGIPASYMRFGKMLIERTVAQDTRVGQKGKNSPEKSPGQKVLMQNLSTDNSDNTSLAHTYDRPCFPLNTKTNASLLTSMVRLPPRDLAYSIQLGGSPSLQHAIS